MRHDFDAFTFVIWVFARQLCLIVLFDGLGLRVAIGVEGAGVTFRLNVLSDKGSWDIFVTYMLNCDLAILRIG